MGFDERDGTVEDTYHFHRTYPWETTVAHVAANRESLADEYFAWVSKQSFEQDTKEMVVRFEEERFGRALEASAHGMLLHAVRWKEIHFNRPVNALFESPLVQSAAEDAASEAQSIDFVDSEAHVRFIAIKAGLIKDEHQELELVKPMPEATDVQPDWMPYKERDDDEDEKPSREPGEDDGEDDGNDWYEGEEL